MTTTMRDLSARTQRKGREQRFTRPLEVRADAGEGTLRLEGYACTFDDPYEMWDWYGEFTELVEPGAFTKTLADQDDVRLLVNHEGLPLARTKSGTLELSQDDLGLFCRASLDEADPDVAAVAPKMRRGDVDQMSFAFQVIRQQWSSDFMERHIKEVKLYDVSIVTFPANPGTSAWLRADQLAVDLSRLAPDELVAAARSAGYDPAVIARRLGEALERVRCPGGGARSIPPSGFSRKLARAQAEALALARAC